MNEWIAQTGFDWADWLIVAIVLVSVVISIMRGFVREALSLLVWVAAFVVAFFFSDRLAPLLEGTVELPSLRYLSAFAILFVITLVIGSLLGYLIGQLVKMTGLSAIDRLLGVMFGVCRGVLICLLILMFLPKLAPVQQDPWWQQSRLIPRVLVLENWSRETASAITGWGKQQLDKKGQYVEKIQQQRDVHGAALDR
jgi:membrane protein required for colicin V production